MKLPLLLAALTVFTSYVTPQEKPEELAQHAADAWLAVVDSGKYADSWKEASQRFKSSITNDRWQSALKATRAPLGAVQSRKLKSATYKTSLPGAPDGQYVVIQYETSFEHKQSAVETVTPTMDADGKWRISGYFIR